jgi:hypothetical protein
MKRKKSKQDDFLQIIRKSDEREHEIKMISLNVEDRKLTLQEKEIELKERELKRNEKNDEHNRMVELRKLELEEKRIESGRIKTEAEVNEKNLLLKVLMSKLN